MKFIVLGLGNFGSELCIKLTELGHEVIGVDRNQKRVEYLKDMMTRTICLDATDEQAIRSLPISHTDVVIIAIGEDQGASIMTTAMMKQMKPKRLISRSISPLHQTVLEAMDIQEIIHPEAETAYRLAKRLDMNTIVDSFSLNDQYKIIEAILPKHYVGRTILATDFRHNFNVNILTVIRNKEKKNALGQIIQYQEVLGMVRPETVLEENDILVMFGNVDDIEKLLKS